MRYATCVASILLSLAIAQPALGWDPDEDPGTDQTPPEWTPEPAPAAPPPGIYLVTETYSGDSIVQSGALTTYSTETIHEVTGSYARVLETVGTGGSSAYDGAAFNGRASMTDGRAVAGTYYENYIWTDAGFVPVSVVFFQDDSEIARASTAIQPQPAAPVLSAPAPGSGSRPAFEPAPVLTPVAGPSAVGVVSPIIDDRDDLVPAAPASPAPLPERSIEVLRGRRIELPFGDGIRGWRFVSGECVALGPLSGTASDPFVARWDRLAPAGATWLVRFLVDRADGTSQQLVVRVAVRAPGLVE